jgi:hypothetical protein
MKGFRKMNAVGRLSVSLLALCVFSLAGCMTASGGRDADRVSSTQTPSSQSTSGEPVRTGIPEDKSTQTNPAPVASHADDRATQGRQTVQVACAEPANAQAGQCFTRILYPAKFNEQQVQEVARPAYDKITYSDPVYEDVEEQVLVREAYTREVQVPALYDTFYEQVLEKPAGKVWVKGHGATERVDPQTGEIYCLVDQPAVYKKTERKELKRPAGTRTEQVPAEYTTKTVHKLVTPPQQTRTAVAAEYQTITKKTLAAGDSCEYVQVLCQDNATQGKIHEVEQALQTRGIAVDNDGLDDEDLHAGLRQFQEQNGLPTTGLMTARTLEALGVALTPVQQPDATSSK